MLRVMSRIILATIGSLGDLHPLIGIGLELHRRGHEVRFCTSETYRPRLESLGFGFDPLRPDATPENPSVAHLVREIMDPRKGTERLIRGLMLPQLKDTYADLLRAVNGPPAADLMLSGELVYPAPIIAEKFGVRWASYITAPMSFFSACDPPVLPPFPRLAPIFRKMGPGFNRTVIRLIKLVTRSWSEPVRALRVELGLPPGKDPIYDGKHGRLVLAIFSPAFAAHQPDWPPNVQVTGFPFYDGEPKQAAAAADLTQFLQNGEAPIVFTLGSSAVLDPGRFYHESAAAAASLKRRAVLLIGRNPPVAPLPQGVVAFPYVGFSQLFPRAAAIVHQGGIGTTGQALRAGCPMLVMPFNFDQPDNAARVVRLGVGRSITRQQYSAPRAAAELNELLSNPSYREQAARIAGKIQHENGAEQAAKAIEHLLQ